MYIEVNYVNGMARLFRQYTVVVFLSTERTRMRVKDIAIAFENVAKYSLNLSLIASLTEAF